MQPASRIRKGSFGPAARAAAAVITLTAVTACGKAGGPGPAAAAPVRSGEVWRIDPAADATAPSTALLAFVSGLHVIVLDGNDVYAGTTRLKAEARDGALVVTTAGRVEAQLVRAGAGRMTLRFATGESIAMVPKDDKKGDLR